MIINNTTGKELKGETQAVYRQFSSALLDEDDALVGFTFDSGSKTPVNDIYVLVAKRARMKDKLEKGTWTLHLTGSTSFRGGGGGYASASAVSSSHLYLTDDNYKNKLETHDNLIISGSNL